MLAYIRAVGTDGLYVVQPVDPVDPGFGHPGGGVDPGYGQGRPGGRPDQGLPGGRPGIPSNELPDTPPPNLAPGWTLVLIRHDGQWQYAAIAPGSPPPRPLPNPPEHVGGRPPGQGMPDRPDQGLPSGPGRPDNTLPGQPGGPTYPSGGPVPPMVGGGPMPTPPPMPGQPLPPTAEPKR